MLFLILRSNRRNQTELSETNQVRGAGRVGKGQSALWQEKGAGGRCLFFPGVRDALHGSVGIEYGIHRTCSALGKPFARSIFQHDFTACDGDIPNGCCGQKRFEEKGIARDIPFEMVEVDPTYTSQNRSADTTAAGL